MFNLGPTFIWVLINLLILYLFMRKFLFKRVTDFMENRAQGIQNNIKNAEKTKAEAEKIKADYEEQLKSAYREADKILKDFRDRAQTEYEAMLKEAKDKIDMLMEKSKVDIERERAEMIREMHDRVASLALAAASKVMEANMDTERNRELVDKFIDEEGVS